MDALNYTTFSLESIQANQEDFYHALLDQTVPKLFLDRDFSADQISDFYKVGVEEIQETLERTLKLRAQQREGGKRLNYEQRRILEFYLSSDFAKSEISEILGCSPSTITYELARVDGDYCAETAERDYNRKNTFERPKKIEDENVRLFIDYAIKNLIENRLGPDVSCMEVKNGDGPEEIDADNIICASTFYSYFHEGLLELKTEDFIEMKEPFVLEESTKGTHSKSTRGYLGIEDRPDLIDPETGEMIFGHFELDLVLGEPGTGALMTLVEKKTRKGFIVPLEGKRADYVNAALKEVIDSFGELAPVVFKSITTDNGKEFIKLDQVGSVYLEDLINRVYFCHVGVPQEKGQNERYNRILRRYVPKGSVIRSYSHSQISKIEITINRMRRRSLNGECPENLFLQELSRIVHEYACAA